MNLMDNMMIGAKVRMWKFRENVKRFFEEEHGVSNVVATVVLVLIVVLIISVFWKSLSKWINEMLNSIFGDENAMPKTGDITSPG